MGEVEQGVYTTLKALGISEPTTAVEALAVTLARAIDSAQYAKDVAPLAARLTDVLDRVANQPAPTHDAVQDMEERY